MPNEIREFGNDRSGILYGQRGFLVHPQTIDATVDTQIIIGGVGKVIALTAIGLTILVHQRPTSRLLTVEQHPVTLIK